MQEQIKQEKIKLEKKFYDIKDVIKEGWKIDKVKISYILRNIDEVQRIVLNLEKDIRVTKRYPSRDIKACAMNYVIETIKGNVYVGVESNQLKIEAPERKKIIIIEYNPSKLNAFEEISYLKKLLTVQIHRRDIISMDLAYDMYIPIEKLEYEKRRTNEYECRISHEKLETIYLRKMGNNGAVRIYDKTLEMNGGTKEEVEEETGEIKEQKYKGDCTRYEIRIKPGKYKKEFNFINHWLLEDFAKLHKLSIKEEGQAEKILKEIEKTKGSEFNNLLMIHLGYEKRTNKNKRKIYKEKYEEIKKMTSDTTPEAINIFKDFNIEKMLKPITNYLKYITTEENNQILLYNILEKQSAYRQTSKYKYKQKRKQKEPTIRENNQIQFTIQ